MTSAPPPQTVPHAAALDRLKRKATLAAWASRIVGTALPILLGIAWATGTAWEALLAEVGPALAPPPTAIWIGPLIAISLLPVLALTRSLFAAAACFDGFAKADWFGPDQPSALTATGRWLAISGALALATPTLVGLFLSLGAAPGERALTVTLSGPGIVALPFGALLWMLGHLWSVARDIAAENARFV